MALLEDFNVLKHSEDEKAVNSFQAKNVIKGTINGFDFSLFDFTSEKYKQDQELSNQTVVYLELKDASLPKFSLRPKIPSETTKNVFGAKKLNLNLGVDFSKKYVLEGEDMKNAMTMFNFNKLNLFGNGITEPIFESNGISAIVFDAGELSDPEDLKSFAEKAIELIIQFKKD